MRVIQLLKMRQMNFTGNKPVVIACLGDSVTHGCFEVFVNEKGQIATECRAAQAYPHMLADALGLAYPFARPCILNAGVSGDNAEGGLKRLERDVLFARPDLVIVNFGLNDAANPMVEEGLTRYAAAMRGIFLKVKASGAECVLLTPNRMCDYVSHSVEKGKLADIAAQLARVQNDGILTRYVDTAKRAAADLDVKIADAYAVWQTLYENGVDTTRMLSNSINHPTPKAHEIFVGALMKTLMEI